MAETQAEIRLQGIYTIPSGQHFLQVLACGVIEALGRAPEQLAQATILLPSRRAVRALRAAFLQEAAEGQALLLPRLLTFGDLDEDDYALGQLSVGLADLPPMIGQLERQWWLATQLRKFDPQLGLPQALAQADELARLLDQLHTFEVEPAHLEALLVETDLAEHWQKTLRFLDIILKAWPLYLATRGMTDRALHRAALLRAQAQRWQDQPPRAPIIIAGAARYEPALLALLQTVQALPQGCIVLPGFDQQLPPEIWQQLDATHPDFLLRDLLERLQIARANVALWPTASDAIVRQEQPDRQRWLREALRPSAAAEGWQALQTDPIVANALDQITLVTLPNEQLEARAVAMIVRHALELNNKEVARTISLVTSDRTLARQVSAQLRRWGIEVDDSGGVPLLRTPLGSFLLLVVAAAMPDASLSDMLALAKHPFAQLGLAEGEFHASIRRFERAALHNGYVVPGFDGWHRALATAKLDDRTRAALVLTLERFQAALQPLGAVLSESRLVLASLLDAHLTAAERLAASNTEAGQRLWQGEEGECAARFFFDARHDLSQQEVEPGRYDELLRIWLAALAVRTPIGQHPRVTIHGLIDARLQQADVTILAGLNEGSWPPAAAVSPFLSRTQYRTLGLPDPESRLGQAAHDFASYFSGGEVYLTRAVRTGGTPTVESRWLLRLRAVLTQAAVANQLQQSGLVWTSYAAQLDQPESIDPQPAPVPTPPIAARPRQLSVTQIHRWLRDPYGLYAEKILRLRALAPLADAPGHRERGELVHSVLEAFTAATLGRDLRPTDRALLDGLIVEALERYAGQPALQQLYRSYLSIVSAFLLKTDAIARKAALPWLVEATGTTEFQFPSGAFTLTARADRVDRTIANDFNLIDYKTGSAPTAAELQDGRAMQLTLTAAIAANGGFGAPGQVEAVEYWQTGSRDNAGGVKRLDGERLVTAIHDAETALQTLVEHFNSVDAAYLAVPVPDRVPPHNDYAQLERSLEWAFAEDVEGVGFD